MKEISLDQLAGIFAEMDNNGGWLKKDVLKHIACALSKAGASSRDIYNFSTKAQSKDNG